MTREIRALAAQPYHHDTPLFVQVCNERGYPEPPTWPDPIAARDPQAELQNLGRYRHQDGGITRGY